MNVVVVLMDTLRRDQLGCYGNAQGVTPALNAFSERATVFTNSYMGSYPCMPARYDLWTGNCTFPWRGWAPLEYDEIDIAQALRDQEVTTQLITDHYHLWQWGSGNYHMSFHGAQFIRGQESDNWITDTSIETRWPADPSKMKPAYPLYHRNTAHFTREEDYFAPSVFRAAMNWAEGNRDQESFLLMIDSFDPHEPWHTPEHYWRLFDPDYQGDHPVWPPYGKPTALTERELKHVYALYRGEVRMCDVWFGRFLEHLGNLGLLDETIVIVTSDHGFLFGEHDWLGKHTDTLYNHIAHTPLLIYHPDVPGGRRVDHLVQLYDLYPTVLEALGARIPESIHGRSLLPMVHRGNQAPPLREVACFGGYGGPLHVTDGEWVYVRQPQSTGPLYWYTRSHFLRFNWSRGESVGKSKDLETTRRHLAHREPDRFLVRGKEEGYEPPPDALYHLPSDPEQYRDTAGEDSPTATRLRSQARAFMKGIQAPHEQLERWGLDG